MKLFYQLSLTIVLTIAVGGSVKSADEPSYIFLSAPSVKDNYYRPKFDELIHFYDGFIKRAAPGDVPVVVADAATIAEIGNRLPRRNLLEGNARDVWVRDSGVIQTTAGIFKTQFRPAYLSASDAKYIEDGFLSWFRGLQFPFEHIDIKLDGGNFCHNEGNRAVTTQRVLDDNPGVSEAQLKNLAHSKMGITELAILPEEAGDTTGHADGMIKWLAPNKIALNNYTNRTFKTQVTQVLEEAFPGIEIVSMPWNPTRRYWRSFADGTGIYVNAMTTPNAIYVPVYGLASDPGALEVFRAHADRRVIPVKVSPDIAVMGGAARCLSCQVSGAPAAQALVPGAGRPSVLIQSPRIGKKVGRRILVSGIARDADGISDVRFAVGNKTGRARLRKTTGKWWFTLRPDRRKRNTLVRVYAFDKPGSIGFKTRKFRTR